LNTRTTRKLAAVMRCLFTNTAQQSYSCIAKRSSTLYCKCHNHT